MPTTKVFICHYNQREKACNWLLTTDEDEARATDQSYDLASIDELRDWEAATGYHFENIILVKDGCCKWFSETFTNRYGDEDYRTNYYLLHESYILSA